MRVRVDFVDEVGVDCFFVVLHLLFSECGREAAEPFFAGMCQLLGRVLQGRFAYASIYS